MMETCSLRPSQSLSGRFGVRTSFKFDGVAACSYTHGHEKIDQRNVTNCFEVAYSNVDGSDYTHKFRFAPLHIDEEADEDLRQELTEIGILTLTFRFIEDRTERKPPRKSSRTIPANKGTDKFLKLSEIESVDEKSMKGDAKSHQAKLVHNTTFRLSIAYTKHTR
ncbi:hypothetical protein EK21DRAFT_93520 [Setomelanomma holmii]|uniref:DUF7918 domain-containing protein n=1 Tax=Setomelanomma holmii TaxID=210430 RepID=A0A9P4GYQ7_9PLEO|nr:hypothetical protein EK21DRAFT_93520 [Setomelanomma holmii]